MNYPRWHIIRCCPRCKQLDVRRSHRKGLLESIVLPLVLLRPYRCNACGSRHLNFIFCQKVSTTANQVEEAE